MAPGLGRSDARSLVITGTADGAAAVVTLVLVLARAAYAGLIPD